MRKMNNWKTTVFGVGASVCAALTTVPQFSEYRDVLAGLAAMLGAIFAVFAKDADVTGGKRQQ